MRQEEYLNIDGLKVNKDQPFIVFSGMPRSASEFNLSEGGKSDHVINTLFRT